MSKELLNIVLDLETLSTSHDAAIIQIGAVVPRFDHKHILGWPFEFQATIKYEDCLESVSRKLTSQDHMTMQWWEGQASRKEVFSGQLDYAEALEQFVDWVKHFKMPVVIWGNGADFDNVVLRHSLDAFGFHDVWSFRNNRCFRTMKNVFPVEDQTLALGPQETKHTALGDARWEARILNEIVRNYDIRSLM